MNIENEELDDAALFNDAVESDPEGIPEPEAEKVEPEKTEAEVVAESELTAEKPVVDDNAPMVPSFRLKQEADARRQLETDLANERAERAALRQRLEALEKPAPKADEAKPTKPDPLLDPDGYERYLEQKFEEKQLAKDRETSLRTAARTYKGEFDEAYKAAQSKVDPALKAMMQASDDPGETLIKWHRSEKAKAEVGDDLTAYKAKLRDEAMKDPEFRKAAMEAWRAEVQPSNNGRPKVDLPPSISGASRANASLRSSNDDVSDVELFALTTG